MTTPRRFKAGDRFQIDGIWYRLIPGRKGPSDLRLEWYMPVMKWRAVTLDHAALILDAISDNENVLYPPPAAGGGKVVQFVRQVFREGWGKAVYQLQMERDLKHNGELYPPSAKPGDRTS